MTRAQARSIAARGQLLDADRSLFELDDMIRPMEDLRLFLAPAAARARHRRAQ